MFRALDWNLVGCGLFPMQILIAWDFHKSQARYVTPLLGGHAALLPCVITQGVCYGGIQLYSFLVGCGYIQVLDWWYGDLVRRMVRVCQNVFWEDSMGCIDALVPPLWCPKHEGRI